MTQTTKIAIVVASVSLPFLNLTAFSFEDGAAHERLDRFVSRLPEDLRKSLAPARRGGETLINEERADMAVKNSIAWMRAVLRPEFIPNEIETDVQVLPAALRGLDMNGEPAEFDCTTVEFEARGYEFRVVQDSRAVMFLTVRAGVPEAAPENAEFFARRLQDWADAVFQHTQLSFYFVPVRITDFGVDTPAAQSVWNSLDKRWRPTVVRPPAVVEDGLLSPFGEGDRSAVVAKLQTLAPNMRRDLIENYDLQWWAKVYVATDGNVMLYVAPKSSGDGQSPFASVPEWFRIAEPGAIPGNIGKGFQGQRRNAPWPPQDAKPTSP